MYFSLSFHLSLKCNLFFHFRYELLQHATLTSVTLPQHKGYNKGIKMLVVKKEPNWDNTLSDSVWFATGAQIQEMTFSRLLCISAKVSKSQHAANELLQKSFYFKMWRLFTRATCLHFFFLKPGHFWQSRIAQ